MIAKQHSMPTIGRAVDASRGTIVFGNGVGALVGDIAHTGEDDYLIVEGHVSGTFDGEPETFLVPLTSIAYVRFHDA